MKVSYFHYVYKTQGPLVHVDEFCRAFRTLGHEINPHGMDNEPSSSFVSNVRKVLKRPLSKYLHEMNTLGKNFSYYQRECRILQQEKPDLVMDRYHLYRSAAAFAARRFHLPYVLWIDSPAAYEQRHYLHEFIQIPGIAEWNEQKVISMADRAVMVSKEIKQYLVRGSAAKGRFEVVPNGVDQEKFSPAVNGREIRAKFPFKDPVILGFVGSFSPWHGIEKLKTWMKFALNKFRQTSFLLIGDGSRRGELENFVRSGGWDPSRVLFTGHVSHDKVPIYISAMDVCLLPYDQEKEGFYFSPLKLFEYMASAKPVLASKMGQIEKVIQDDQNGMLYSPCSSEETYGKLKQLINDPALRLRLGENARKTILENYTWRHTALAAERIFESVLKECRGS